MESLKISHDILIAGSDFEFCRQRVKHFFDRTTLIRYDEALVIENDSINGTEKNFPARIQEGLGANQKIVAELLANLKDEGFISLDDLASLEKGIPVQNTPYHRPSPGWIYWYRQPFLQS